MNTINGQPAGNDNLTSGPERYRSVGRTSRKGHTVFRKVRDSSVDSKLEIRFGNGIHFVRRYPNLTIRFKAEARTCIPRALK